tara:strand:- start:2139 stop:3059 length:921 start_codon:yes stop_codon:yes gene_type:complete
MTDGSQGMISQVKGLAEHIDSNFQEKIIKLKWPWSILQPGILPIYKNIFNIDFIERDLPKILITCGRKSVYASIYLKKKLKDKITTIHIQNPKINANKFDYVVSPNHDKLKGDNVINSFGAIHNLTEEIIDNSQKIFEIPNNKKIVTIILGGENNHYKLTNVEINKLISLIEKLNNLEEKYYFLFVSSRRTDLKLIDILKNKFTKKYYVWDKNSINPYKYSLKISDYIILTSDSTSMISEATITGKPIFIFHLPFKRKSLRFESFHKEFQQKGITRPFEDRLYSWSYEPLNEAKRIAGILNTKILK